MARLHKFDALHSSLRSESLSVFFTYAMGNPGEDYIGFKQYIRTGYNSFGIPFCTSLAINL